MKKFFKCFAIAAACLIGTGGTQSNAAEVYKPNSPVEKVNKSLTMVEKRVRGAAVKVITSGGHGSGTVVEYKDLTLVLTAKHVADGILGSEYLISNDSEQRTGVLVFQSKEHDVAVLVLKNNFNHLKPMPWKPAKKYEIGTDIVLFWSSFVAQTYVLPRSYCWL